MLPELGLLSLIAALCLAVMQCLGVRTALLQIILVVTGYVILTTCFVLDDFTVQYVAHNSNSSLPLYYKITAVWGAHAGSLLLWILVFNLWFFGLYLTGQHWREGYKKKVFAVMSGINACLLWLQIHTSNPFTRYIYNTPLDGADLNPLLQDFAMIIHPPILYIGYVGTAAAFALTFAALWENSVDQKWAGLVRPWVLLSWVFLTLGIGLGSWWAYYELGWGGWWFWDPVENASFMPWLTTTALLHSLAVAKPESSKRMAVFLVIVSFALSIFGTFLVRSGAVVSVHAFAADPQRGMYILQFLALSCGAAMLMYALRIRDLKNQQKLSITKLNLAILANNILLLCATAVVLIGTMLPMICAAFTDHQITVGHTYFNAVFIPIMLVLFAIMLPALVRRKQVLVILSACIVLAAIFLYCYFGVVKIYALVGVSLALSVAVSAFARQNLAMRVAHLGLAFTIIGMSITPNYEIEQELTLNIGDAVHIGGFAVTFSGVQTMDGANYIAYRGDFLIDGQQHIYPEKRLFLTQEMVMTETAIDAGVLQDIYIALGQQLQTDVWSARIYYKPFVRWIWFGVLLMALGGLCSVLQILMERFRVVYVVRKTLQAFAHVA